MRIAHLSDIHLGAELPAVVEGLDARLHELRPDLIVASGDFTTAGRHREYLAARAFLERLPAPVVATPGNHDLPVLSLHERFAAPLRRYHRYLAPVTSDRHISPDAAILALNSARPASLALNWSHGRLSLPQIDRADRFFTQHHAAPFKALVVHHPFVVPDDLPGFRVIGNADRMLRVLARHGVHAVLAGHLHRQFTTTRRITLEHGSHEIQLLQVATAVSSRHRNQPNAFAVLHTHTDGFEVTEEIWTGSRFEPRAALANPGPQQQSRPAPHGRGPDQALPSA